MNALGRYSIPDAYVLQELQSKYELADVQGKILLLKSLINQQKTVPVEIERLAVEDPNVPVRRWIARHGTNLKYTSHLRHTESGWVHTKIEPDFYDRLGTDPDPLVRASLLENPNNVSFLFDNDFKAADHLGRLALMRNSEMFLRSPW